MSRDTFRHVYQFLGHGRPPVVASPDGSIWRSKITGAAPPTVGFVAGHAALALTSATQAQITTLYFGDELGYSILDLLRVTFWAKISDALAAATSAAFGVSTAQNDTVTSMTAMALFRTAGNNNVILDTDDNTNVKTAIATGLTMGSTLKRFEIDFSQGLADVRFSMDNAQGHLRRVAPAHTFNMSGHSTGLQLFAQMQKSSDAATGTLSIRQIEVEGRIN